jgi:hypothetical protein
MEREMYSVPEMEIFRFNAEDVIVLSGEEKEIEDASGTISGQ